MSENRKRILDMLSEGKITVDDAERLLAALNEDGDGDDASDQGSSKAGRAPKYFYVKVDESGEDGERINVRVPLALIKAGVNLSKLIPSNAAKGINQALGEKGINIDVHNLGGEEIDELIEALSDFEVEVQGPEEQIHVYVG